MSQDEKIDGLFMTGLQSVNGIEPFFDCLFSFLRRKTDFYNAPSGFNTIKFSHERHQKKFEEQKEKELKKKQKQEEEKKKQAEKQTEKVEPSVREITPEEAQKRMKEEQERANNPTKVESSAESEKAEDGENKDGEKKEEYKGLKPIKNGSVTDVYSWEQPLINQLTVNIPLPDGTRGKDVVVKSTSKTLFVQLKGQTPLIDGEYCKPTQADSFYWTIEESFGKKYIDITIEKLDKMSWWDCLIKGEPVIDTSKISPESSKVEDLDPEMQKTVRKMMYDQQRKAQGLPVSDDEKKYEMLEKFKKAHPEMDFSNAKFG